MGELNSKAPEQEGAIPAGPAPSAPGSARVGVLSPAALSAVSGFQVVGRALPRNLSSRDVLQLQRTVGNQAVSRLIVPGRGHAALARQPAAAPAAPKAPASGPPGPATAPPGTGPAAPVSDGIDWDAFWAGSGPNEIRTVLEVLRLYPGWGLLAGGAADIINTKQDIEAIKGEDAPWIEGALAVRSAVMIVNNGVGHLVYVTELIQDLATASVVGAELDALTATVNEALLTVKVGLDGAQFLLDFGLICGAKYRSMTAPPGDSRKAWDGMVANYEANLLGDLVGGIFDVIDLSSAGFANAGPVKTGAKAAKGVFDTAKLVKGLVKSVLQGWFGVWGSAAFEKGAPGGGLGRLAEQEAATHMLTELQSMKACYVVGDTIIGVAADLVAQQITELNAAATVALGGKDPFVTARDAAVEGLDTMQKRLGELAEMGVMASTASEKTEMVTAFADRVLGLLAAIVVPEIQLPEADIGDDAVSDAAEGLLNLGGEIAGAGVNLLIGQLNGAVDEAKSSLSSPMEDLKANAVDIGKFFQVVTDEARNQVQVGQAKVADIGGKLAKCNNFEDVVNMIIDQIFEMVGFHSDFEIDDIRKTWTAIGPAIDGAILWAEALRDGRQAPFPLFDDDKAGAPVVAGAADDPAQGGGAGGAAGGGGPGGGAGAAAGAGAPGGATGGQGPAAALGGAAAGSGPVVDVNQIVQAGAAAGAAGAAQAGSGAAGGAAGAAQAGAGAAAGGAAGAAQTGAGAAGGAAGAAQTGAGAAAGGAAGAAPAGGAAAGGGAAGAAQTGAGAAGGDAGGVPEKRRRP
jgi:hypothetical protein